MLKIRLFFPLVLCMLLASCLFTVQPIYAASTIVVDSLDDERGWNGTCSLRDAVIASNSNRPIDTCPAGNRGHTTIVLDPSLAGGTLALSHGALYIQDNTTIIADVLLDAQFVSQHFVVTQYSSLTIEQMALRNGRSQSGGGSIRVDSGSLALRDVSFKENVANVGGAIVMNSGSLSIDGADFTNNRAEFGGGAIFTKHPTTINNSTFYANTSNTGGAIYATNRLVIESTYFRLNDAVRAGRQYGGAIYAENNYILLRDNTFYSNFAGSGGAVYVVNGQHAIFNRNLFDENHTTIKVNSSNTTTGGAVTLIETVATFRHDRFTGNDSSIGGGGAIGIYGSTTGIYDAEFANNTVDGSSGGAVSAEFAALFITRSLFNANESGYGGGLLVSHGDLTLTNSVFVNNMSHSFGGGILLQFSEFVMKDTDFFGNEARVDGGAIMVGVSRGSVENAYFQDNKSGDWGGAMNVTSNSVALVQNSTFESNVAANQGGAIWNFGELTIDHTSFAYNEAGNGGALYSYGGNLTVRNGTFAHNIARTSGGGIVNLHGDALVQSSEFFGHNALNGSVIYNESGTTEIFSAEIYGNAVNAINNVRGTVVLGNSTVRDSQYANCVGAITPAQDSPNVVSDASCR